jgi:hydroxyacylglutathione hydrolase
LRIRIDAVKRCSFAAVVALALCGCAPRFQPVKSPALLEPMPASIARVELRYSNMYLLRKGAHVALVDAGAPSDVERATAALRAEGLEPGAVELVVLTHGHGDHAGLGSFFQKAGAKVVVGRGDELQTTKGENDEMTPQSLFARMLKPFVRLDYPTFTPDLVVDDELNLGPFGFDGVRARHMPGHTRGAIVVLVGNKDAIVGDQMLGGIWGGLFHAGSAGDHYYQLDAERNKCNVHTLLEEGFETFHLGHGGPVSRDAVLGWEKSWRRPCSSGPEKGSEKGSEEDSSAREHAQRGASE